MSCFLLGCVNTKPHFFARKSMHPADQIAHRIQKSCEWPTTANSNKIPEELFSIHILYSCPSSASGSDVSQLGDLCSWLRL